MRTYAINRFGRIILSGQNGTEFYAFIPAKDGIIGVGIGWEGFCAANGVKKGVFHFGINFSAIDC